VPALLAQRFGGRKITVQNLSRWKRHGYREWLDWQQTRELAGMLGLQLLEQRSFERVVTNVSVQYAALISECGRLNETREKAQILGRICRDLKHLRYRSVAKEPTAEGG
jgi:hypothetical protein